MELTILKNRSGVILLVFLLLSILSLGCQPSDSTSERAAEEKQAIPVPNDAMAFLLKDENQVIPDPYSGGQIVAYLASTAVTYEELENFFLGIMGGVSAGHGGGESVVVFKALPVFHRFQAVVEEATRMGLDQSSVFKKGMRFGVLAALAKEFRSYYVLNAPVEGPWIADRIPKRWIQMNFSLKTFKSEEAAAQALSHVSSPEDFYHIREDVPLARKRISETGMVFPGSGFFEEWDDRDLYGLEEGQVHGPVKTGVGWAIVLVKEKKVFSASEQEQYIADLRSRYSQNWALDRFAEFQSDRKIEILEGSLEKSVAREVTGGGFSDDPILIIDDDVLTYRVFRLLNLKDYGHFPDAYPRASWKMVVLSDLKPFINQFLVGLMAEKALKDGEWEQEALPPYLHRQLYNFRKSMLYYTYLDNLKTRFMKTVTDSEVDQFFRDNPEIFKQPQSAEIAYAFSKQDSVAARWREILSQGGSFADAINATDKSIGDRPILFSEQSGKIFRTKVFHGDAMHRDIQDGIFSIKEGQSDVLDGKMGHYLVSVETRTPSYIPSKEEWGGQIRDAMVRDRFRRFSDEKINALAAAVKVTVLGGQKFEKQPMDIPHPDLG